MVSGNDSSTGVGWRRFAGVVAASATLLSMGALVAPAAMADDGVTLGDVVAADTTGGARAASAFVDVNEATPHAGNIAWLASSGVSTGWTRADGRKEFRPTLAVTRQDMAAFLYRVAGSPAFDENKAANPFKDVTPATPHYKEILWLSSSKISTGWKDGTFRGMDTVKRQDMAAFLHRLAYLKKANPKLGATIGFKDVNTSTPHQEDIVWLARTGVTTGWKDGTFRGMTAVIRQDMAAFLQRTHDNVLNTKPSQPSQPDKPSEPSKPVDRTAPVFSGVKDVVLDYGAKFDARAGVTAKDDVNGDLTAKIMVSGNLNTSKAGTYTFTYTVSDKAGNKATATRKVTVKTKPDKTAPVFSGVKDVAVDYGAKFDAKAGVTAKDAVDGDLTAKIAVSGSVDTGKAGTYTLTYTVSDKAGNKATATRRVTVKAKPDLLNTMATRVREAGDGWAITEDGSLWKWGWNDSGIVGDGTAKDRLTPYRIPEFSHVKSYSGNGHTAIVVTENGDLWMWGNNNSGQLGDGTTNDRYKPYRVSALSNVEFAGLGTQNYSSTAYAVTKDGSLWIWGDNQSGQVGDGSTENRLTPYRIPNIAGVKSIFLNDTPPLQYDFGSSVSVVTDNGSLWMWGFNANSPFEEWEIDDYKYDMTPHRIDGLPRVKAAGNDGDTAYAIGVDGTLWMWNINYRDEFDENGIPKDHPTLRKISGLADVKDASTLDGSSYAVTGDGSLWTWGSNDYGQLGDGTTVDRLTPYKVPGLTNVKTADVGLYSSYAVTGDGSLWVWGLDESEESGDGTAKQHLTPYKVPGLTDVKAYAAGTSYAVTGDGSLWKWGSNDYGRVGDGTTKDRFNPYKVPGLAGIKMAGDGLIAYAVSINGDLWTWGYNEGGSVGDGTTETKLTPHKMELRVEK